jgi:hypothetical protein
MCAAVGTTITHYLCRVQPLKVHTAATLYCPLYGAGTGPPESYALPPPALCLRCFPPRQQRCCALPICRGLHAALPPALPLPLLQACPAGGGRREPGKPAGSQRYALRSLPGPKTRQDFGISGKCLPLLAHKKAGPELSLAPALPLCCCSCVCVVVSCTAVPFRNRHPRTLRDRPLWAGLLTPPL